MTEAEIQAVVDQMAARSKAARSATWAKVRAYVLHNAFQLGAAVVGTVVVMKFL